MKLSVHESSTSEDIAVTHPLLITSKTCPACRVAAAWLDKKGVAYTKAYADENPAIAEKYAIKSIPAMVVRLPDGKERILLGFHEIRAHFS